METELMSVHIKDKIIIGLVSLTTLAVFYFQYIMVGAYPFNLYAWFSLLVSVALFLGYSHTGNQFIGYVKASRAEVMRVVWPDRRDIVVTTVAVGVAVAIISGVITLLDSVLVRVLSLITG